MLWSAHNEICYKPGIVTYMQWDTLILIVTTTVNKYSMLMLGVFEIELGEPWIVKMYVVSIMWHHFARYLPVNQQHTCNKEFSNSTIVTG